MEDPRIVSHFQQLVERFATHGLTLTAERQNLVIQNTSEKITDYKTGWSFYIVKTVEEAQAYLDGIINCKKANMDFTDPGEDRV